MLVDNWSHGSPELAAPSETWAHRSPKRACAACSTSHTQHADPDAPQPTTRCSHPPRGGSRPSSDHLYDHLRVYVCLYTARLSAPPYTSHRRSDCTVRRRPAAAARAPRALGRDPRGATLQRSYIAGTLNTASRSSRVYTRYRSAVAPPARTEPRLPVVQTLPARSGTVGISVSLVVVQLYYILSWYTVPLHAAAQRAGGILTAESNEQQAIRCARMLNREWTECTSLVVVREGCESAKSTKPGRM